MILRKQCKKGKNMSNKIVRSAVIIADEINQIKSQTHGILSAAYSYAHRSCMEIGKRLIEAKELVPFGEWGDWLKNNFAYSESTAGNLMRIYREFGNEQIDFFTGKSPAETFEGLTQSQMTELFALPQVMRADFVEEHREELLDGEMSIREMRELIRQQKQTIEKQEKDILDNDESYGALVEQKKETERENGDLKETISGLQEELEGLKKRPVEMAVEKVYEPSKEQIKEIRADAVEKTEKKYKSEIDKLTEELQAKDAEKEQALKAAEEEHLKKLRQLTSKSDPHGAKVLFSMEQIARALSDICREIGEMEKEAPGTGVKMQMRCESNLLGLINKVGWSV